MRVIWHYCDTNNYFMHPFLSQVRREKAVYDTLNMLNFDVTKKCLVGEGWCPIFAKTQVTCFSLAILIFFFLVIYIVQFLNFLFVEDFYMLTVLFFEMIEQIQAALQRATIDSNSQVGIIFHLMDAVESPPTYFRTNKLTNAFQEIVDAYG